MNQPVHSASSPPSSRSPSGSVGGMMKKPIAYGIDFGTTNSSISIAYDNGDVDDVDLVVIDENSVMPHSLPSIVYLDRDDNRLAGSLAVDNFFITGSNNTICGNCSLVKITKTGIFTKCRQRESGGGCQDARLMSGLKSQLAPSQNSTTHSWAKNFDLEELVSIILSDLKTRADHLTGREVNKAVISFPIVFTGAQGDDYDNLQGRARARLKRAAERARFSDIELLSEPEAVLLDHYLEEGFDEGYSLAVDFGGGTYDVAVLSLEKEEAEVISSQGAAVGGEMFDALVFDNAMADAVGINQVSNGKRLPKWISKRMRTLSGIAELLRDKNLLPALHAFADGGADISVIDEILFGGQAYNFYKAIENAKIDLSESQTARIDFSRPDSGINISQAIRRKDFEGWIRPYLDKVDEATRAALDKADIKPEQVHTVLRTGGSSMIPLFINRLKTVFPKATIRERPTFTSVAYGLGIYALEVWGND